MNSILANIFLSVQERILAEVPAIKWIDQDLGQIDFESAGPPPVLIPAVLIDLPDTDYSDLTENCQLGESSLEIRLVVANYSPSGHVHSQANKTKALEYYDLEHKINQALHGWSNEYITPLSRKKGTTEKRPDSLRVRVLRFGFAFNDDTARQLPATTVARPGMELV